MKKSAFNHWKNGSIPAADVAVKIAQFLGVSVEFLVTGEEPSGATGDELRMIADFRQLDERGKNAVLSLIRQELDYFNKVEKRDFA